MAEDTRAGFTALIGAPNAGSLPRTMSTCRRSDAVSPTLLQAYMVALRYSHLNIYWI